MKAQNIVFSAVIATSLIGSVPSANAQVDPDLFGQTLQEKKEKETPERGNNGCESNGRSGCEGRKSNEKPQPSRKQPPANGKPGKTETPSTKEQKLLPFCKIGEQPGNPAKCRKFVWYPELSKSEPVIINVDSETCAKRGGRPLPNGKCLLLPSLNLAITI